MLVRIRYVRTTYHTSICCTSVLRSNASLCNTWYYILLCTYIEYTCMQNVPKTRNGKINLADERDKAKFSHEVWVCHARHHCCVTTAVNTIVLYSLWSEGVLLAESVGDALRVVTAVHPQLKHQEPPGSRFHLHRNHLPIQDGKHTAQQVVWGGGERCVQQQYIGCTFFDGKIKRDNCRTHSSTTP